MDQEQSFATHVSSIAATGTESVPHQQIILVIIFGDVAVRLYLYVYFLVNSCHYLWQVCCFR